MPTWNELQTYLRQRFTLASDQADAFTLGFELTLSPGRTQAQGVHGRHEVHDQESWLHALADVCPAAAMDSTAALLRNATLLVGAIALREERCIVHHAWPLRTAALAEIERGLQYLAMGAVVLQELVQPPDAVTMESPEPPASAAPPHGPNRHFSD